MSLHKEPTNRAEQFALHLEQKYGLQLDLPRTNALVAELQEFANPTNPLANPRDPFGAVSPDAAIVVPLDTVGTALNPANPFPSYPTDAFVKPADSPALTQAVAYPDDPFAKRTDAPVPIEPFADPAFYPGVGTPATPGLVGRMDMGGNVVPINPPEAAILDAHEKGEYPPFGLSRPPDTPPVLDPAKTAQSNDFLTRLRTGEPGDAA